MNKTTAVVGGIIILALIAAAVFLYTPGSGSIVTNDTSTPGAVEGGSPAAPAENVVQGPPVATTNATVAPTDTTAVVTGTVNPKGAITTYWYEYGTTSGLGSRTAAQVAGSGQVAILTPGYITGLNKNTTYYFRLVAENKNGRVAGAQNTVKTTQGVVAPTVVLPTAKTLAATGVTKTAANLSGEVDPNAVMTQYWFEYGKNAELGNTTSFTSVGSGNTTLAASAPLTNLEAKTTYYYRLNAQNQFGTVNGAILTFKTK